MQVTETQNEGLKRGYKITVPAAELDAKVTEKLEEARPEIEMKGFRKGKVPLPILKRQFGPRLLGEAMQEAIDGAMGKHFEESGDRPATQPEVRMTNENWTEGEDIEVEITYENLPEIPAVEFKSLKLERLVVEPDEAEIDDTIARLAEQAQDFVDRPEGEPAEEGDQVVIDFVGRIDGEAFEGGTAEDYPLVLGSGNFIPGFEEQLIGAKAGDKVEVKVTFPEDYGVDTLAGKEAVFETTVKAVKAPKPAEINDELAQRFGAENLEALRAQIAERLGAEFQGAARAVLKRKLLDMLDAEVDFELPETLLEPEAQQIAHQLWHEEHPEEHGHDHGEIEVTEEHRNLARRRVKLGLLLAEIGREAEIEISDAEFTQAIMQQARQYPGQEREFFEFVQQNPELRQQIQAPLFEDKVVDYITELAEVEEKPATKEDLEKAVEALDEA